MNSDESGDTIEILFNLEDNLLTDLAVQAITKSWEIELYNPSGMEAAGWLKELLRLCEEYEVPSAQRAEFATHKMGGESQEAAVAAGCYDMKWDQFEEWLLKYSGTYSLADSSLLQSAEIFTS